MLAETRRMTDTQPMGEMSPAILAMLRDEANLATARHVLDDARQDFLSRREALQAQRPAFGLLGFKKQREDYANSVAAVDRQLAAIDAMLVRINTARERLQPGLRASLVDHLNRADPMYRQGLRASRFHERWRRGHAIVADRLKAFSRELRQVRAAMLGDVENARGKHSSETTYHLGNLRKAAVELDREIEALNAVSAEHQRLVETTPFGQILLPRIEPWKCTEKVDMLSFAIAGQALAEADALTLQFADLRGPTLDTLLGMFEVSAGEHAQMAESRLRQCWSALLAHAEAHLVSDAELEPTLLDIEQRQAEMLHRQSLAQEVRPFETER
jgi:hypothetical protein